MNLPFGVYIRWSWLCRLARWVHFSPDETVVAVKGINCFLIDRRYGSRMSASPVWDRARFKWWLSRLVSPSPGRAER